MSFMEGFGRGFSTAFNQQRALSAKRRDDMFEKTFDSFLKKQEQYQKDEATDTRNISKAKSMTQQYGQPEEAWQKVYQWLQEGQSDSDIRKLLETGKFAVEKQGTETKISEKPIQPAPMATQTTEAFPGPAPAPVAPRASQTTGGLFPRLFGNGPNLLGQQGTVEERNFNATIDRIAQTQGISPDVVRQRLTQRYQSPVSQSQSNLNISFLPGREETDPLKLADVNKAMIARDEAQAAYTANPSEKNAERLEQSNRILQSVINAETFKSSLKQRESGLGIIPPTRGLAVDENGNTQLVFAHLGPNGEILDNNNKPINNFIYMDDNASKYYRDALDSQSSDWKEQITKVNEFKNLIRDYAEIGEAIQNKPELLAQTTSDAASFLQRWAQEAFVASDLLGVDLQKEAVALKDKIENNKGTIDDLQTVTSLEAKIENLLGRDINDLASQNALFAMKTQLFAYKVGMLMGQEGRGLAETERKIFEEIARGGNTPEKYNQNIGRFLASAYSDLVEKSKTSAKYNNAIRNFETYMGGNIKAPVPSIPSVDELLEESDDPYIQAGYQKFREYLPKKKETQSSEGLEATSEYTEGMILENPDTGEKVQLLNGEWVKVQ